MPEYLSPGVYIEEVDMGAKPIEGVSTSTAGFLGQVKRGPVKPQFVTSFAGFQNLYGGFHKDYYLPYIVDGFFRNGGQRCFIGRINGNKATHSSTIFQKSAAGASGKSRNVLKITSIGPGDFGNNIVVIVESSTSIQHDPNLFKITVNYWDSLSGKVSDKEINLEEYSKPDIIEIYDNLTPLESSIDFYERRINNVSNLIFIQKLTDDKPDNTAMRLSGGKAGDPIGAAAYVGETTQGSKTGLAAFEEIDEISLVCVPDEVKIDGIADAVITHCEKMKDRFAILQTKKDDDSIDVLSPKIFSKYAALYYPWLKVIDPVTNVGKLIPPGGHIVGVYARSDIEKGVHKAPANEVLRGVQELQYSLTKAEQDMLNPRGVNCIRAFRGSGIKVWGARTISSDPAWKYVNIRRLFLYLEESIEDGTRWVVFEPNNEELWSRVIQTVTHFLTGVWRDGALMGNIPEQAFFVKCDRSTMSQDDIDNGRIIMVIGVAPVKPAEFVIFRISQWQGGTAAAE